MIVRFTPAARDELRDILTYIEERNPVGARKVASRVRRALDLVVEFPQHGAPTDVPGIRRVLALPYPYVIFYEVLTNEIVVHRVRHVRRERIAPRAQD
ncbi:MAG: type II toxin-antitoxin system RelE/ParE family toxin [Alphaproteobacteria bacterium]|nr:type II toxin-antitoxin system RelE/ParE family toxin [Alphaproteobacteria bacterium]MCW5743512.1 type II toxin-antitoxin system RelE/ParE family toxin [Alphaproteobacteria bacterium]